MQRYLNVGDAYIDRNFIQRGKTMAIDPICKMTVDEKAAKLKSDYKGKTYYFCAPGCKKAFDADPAKYV